MEEYKTWHGRDYKSGLRLAEILDELDNCKIDRKVNGHVHSFFEKISSLDRVIKYKEFFLSHAYHDIKNTISSYNYPRSVKTHLLGFVRTVYREEIKKALKEDEILGKKFSRGMKSFISKR